mmetsp:Transcript_16622/g.29295  ORF Transcript_16622/g.29295 Transcript_16622/m.29295 type:complete len:218 (+) Transcript_16622:375-1028(+)
MLLFNNLLWIGIEPHIDPRIILHLLLQMISHIPIKSPQEQIATIHQCHITPQSIHNTRKLQGNESSAHDNNPLGLLFQIEYLVGSDGVFDSGNVVGFEGPSAHGNEDIFGGDGGCLARGGGVDGDGVGTVEGSRGFDDLDAGVFEYKVLVDVVESSDFLKWNEGMVGSWKLNVRWKGVCHFNSNKKLHHVDKNQQTSFFFSKKTFQSNVPSVAPFQP